MDELKSILVSNPNLHHQADLITEMWEQRFQNGSFADEGAYMRHVMKYKDEFFAEESNQGGAPEFINEDLEDKKASFLLSLFSRESLRTNRLTIISLVTLIIGSIGAIYFLPGKKNAVAAAKQEFSSVVTKNGNRTKVVLPDGSQVWLNAGSSLDYNNSTFNKDLREVSLDGEAYFDVTRDESKPFIIHTKKMDIKVIGTTFNVRSYSDEKIAEAALIKGTIEVTLKDRDQKLVLKPNEKITVANEIPKPETKTEKITARSSPVPVPQIVVKELKPNATYNIIGEIAWTQNKLYFEDETLEHIGTLIERWFGKKVTIANESLKTVHYTGNFENETMEEVLSYLKLSKSFNFRIGTDNVVIY
ncbi:MAG TPA: FecR domain-containing protein [Chitinophagaceae bacterium]|nr:FecR domain-containing protein [Chitinophagaceae bacterium]